MKYPALFVLLLLLLLQGCNLRQQEDNLNKREAALNEKEQRLLLKERTLQLKEEELLKKQQLADSLLIADTIAKYDPALVGNWDVKMTCTETTCTGSAIGDTKAEIWDISYQENNVIAKAKVNDELVRVYSGIYTGNTLELSEMLPESAAPTRKIIVRLQLAGESKLQGQREIDRLEENCRIVYTMDMSKK